MHHICAVRPLRWISEQKWTVAVILINVFIHRVLSSDLDRASLLKAEKAIDKTFEKLRTLQKNKMFLHHKLQTSLDSANQLDDEVAMLKIEIYNLPNILHSDIFKITKQVAKDWGIFNENDIADMYIFSKISDKSDKNVIIGFKTIKAKRKWLSCYKAGALAQGLKSLKGYEGVPVSYTTSLQKTVRFNMKMIDHVSRYKAFLLSVCLGKARTINKFDHYRFWVNNSQIHGVCKYAYGGPSGYPLKSFIINTFDDISREIT